MEKLANLFLRFSEQATGSPMYEYLSKLISQDEELLAIASCADTKQPVPNLFFAAVQFLLIQWPQESLARYYPSLGGQFIPSIENFESFKIFCKKFESEICEILKTKLVQTNEVQRCALLFPAVNLVSRMSKQPKITLIDVGASGGLNFLMDHAHIKYSDGAVSGPVDSLLQIQCESRGHKIPQLQGADLTQRIGIDLNPINLLNEIDSQWNLALLWPDQVDRISRFKMARKLLEKTTIEFKRGDANLVLPEVMSQISELQLICVLHSFTLNQFSNNDREIFEKILATASLDREIWRVSLEWIGTENPELLISKYANGKFEWLQKIAECSGHGEWIHWLQEKE